VPEKTDRDDEVRSIAASLRQIILVSESLQRFVDVFERCLNYLIVTDDLFRDYLSDFLVKLDQIKDEMPDKDEIHHITRELEQNRFRSHIRSLQVAISQQYENRDKLMEQSAMYGAEPPIEVTNKIIAISVTIDKLESELGHYRSLLNGKNGR